MCSIDSVRDLIEECRTRPGAAAVTGSAAPSPRRLRHLYASFAKESMRLSVVMRWRSGARGGGTPWCRIFRFLTNREKAGSQPAACTRRNEPLPSRCDHPLDGGALPTTSPTFSASRMAAPSERLSIVMRSTLPGGASPCNSRMRDLSSRSLSRAIQVYVGCARVAHKQNAGLDADRGESCGSSNS